MFLLSIGIRALFRDSWSVAFAPPRGAVNVSCPTLDHRACRPRRVQADDIITSGVGVHAAPWLVDIDNDGDLDLLVSSERPSTESSSVLLFRNIGTHNVATFSKDGAQLSALAPPLAAFLQYRSLHGNLKLAIEDINGDGKLDLLVTRPGYVGQDSLASASDV